MMSGHARRGWRTATYIYIYIYISEISIEHEHNWARSLRSLANYVGCVWTQGQGYLTPPPTKQISEYWCGVCVCVCVYIHTYVQS